MHALLKTDARSAPKGPTIEMSTVENIAALKFLKFAQQDVAYQMTQMSQDRKVSKSEFENAREGALVINAYLQTLIAELDRVIGEAMKLPPLN